MGKIIGGSPFGRGDALIQVDGAVLLSDVAVAVVGAGRQTGVEAIIALELGGRVNHTMLHSESLYLLDAEGAAILVSEVLGVAGRMDPWFLDMLLARIAALPRPEAS